MADEEAAALGDAVGWHQIQISFSRNEHVALGYGALSIRIGFLWYACWKVAHATGNV